MAAYEPSEETFELVVPASYTTDGTYGVLVWINANDSGKIPRGWEEVLGRHRLIWAGVNRAGNDREVSHRIALALDAVHAVENRYPLDPKRTFVSGFSGGAKCALSALLLYPDVFDGAVLCAGADYFRDIPAAHVGSGLQWPARFERPLYLSTAKERPIALITGDGDPNLAHMSDVLAAMKEDSLTATLFHVPRLGHKTPTGADLGRVLQWMDKGSLPPD